MKQHFEVSAQCSDCDGTGLFRGFAEGSGAAVVCSTCRGTGCRTLKLEWYPFVGRQPRKGVRRVFKANPGIGIGEGSGYSLSDFGGMHYEDWERGVPFPRGSEMRRFTCPAWWYQCADYKKKPEWEECFDSLGSSFSKCKHFKTKEKCWERFDRGDK